MRPKTLKEKEQKTSRRERKYRHKAQILPFRLVFSRDTGMFIADLQIAWHPNIGNFNKFDILQNHELEELPAQAMHNSMTAGNEGW